MNQSSVIEQNLSESIHLKSMILEDKNMISHIQSISDQIISAYKHGKKVLFCGNGGSAADAQHLAAEFSGRYYYDRPALSSEALHVNTSYITAVANDYSFEEVYARLISAIGDEGDFLIALSTSGNSQNVVNALEKAKSQGMITVGFSGESGGKMAKFCDILIAIPSRNTPRIQECHMLIGHSICELVEQGMFPK